MRDYRENTVKYGDNGKKTVRDGERRFHRTFTVVYTYGERTSFAVFTALSQTFTALSP